VKLKLILTMLCVLLSAVTLLTAVAVAEFDTSPVWLPDSGLSFNLTAPDNPVGVGVASMPGMTVSGAPANILSIPKTIGTPTIPANTSAVPGTDDQMSAITSPSINLIETPYDGSGNATLVSEGTTIVLPDGTVITGGAGLSSEPSQPLIPFQTEL